MRVLLSRAIVPFVVDLWVIGVSLGLPARAAAVETPTQRGATGIAWASSFENALEEAQIDGKIVMVDFFTDWCGWCRRLDSDTYSNADVAAHARRIVCVKVNAERRTDLARRYGVRVFPTITFLRPDGTQIDGIRGYLPPRQFIPVLDRVTDSAGERFTLVERLRDHPDLVDVRCDLARLMIRAGESAVALAEIDTCLRSEGALPEEKRWDLHLDRGRLLLALGRAHEARKELKEYVDSRKKAPRHAEAVFFYAEACFADGDRKEARKFYRRLLDEKPQGWLADRSRSRLGDLGWVAG